MSQPRVAVVGGGIAGTLCSLVLRNRGLHPVLVDGSHQMGGRLRGGAQFWRTENPRLVSVTSMLNQAGLLVPWKGRFGVLGSSGGGFLPAGIVSKEGGAGGVRGMSKADGSEDEEEGGGSGRVLSSVIDSGDFCHFIEGSNEPTLVGVPSMGDLCNNICKLGDIECLPNTKVIGAEMVPGGGWKLNTDTVGGSGTTIGDETFDAIVLATHDPSLASGIVHNIVSAELAAGGFSSMEDAATSKEEKEGDDASKILIRRLSQLADSLQVARDQGRVPTYTISATYPKGFSDSIPFDAVTVPGSPLIQFLLREASKPGAVQDSEGGETWTAVSTSSLAVRLLSSPELSDEDRLSAISTMLSEEMSRLLMPHHPPGDDVMLPLNVSAKRWGASFCSKGLNLKEDSVTLAPWRLSICGDYLSEHGTPLEAAALSGLEAGERTASLFAE
jgi:predicted NAD/FAD-dependent oxidoreductase